MAVTIRFDGDPTSAVDASNQVEDSFGRVADAAGDLARDGEDAARDLGEAFSDAGDEIGDAGEAGGDALDDLGEATEGASVSTRSLGRIAKEAIQGDLIGAASAALPVIGSLGPQWAIAGGLVIGTLATIKGAIEAQTDTVVADAGEAAKWGQAYSAAASTILGAAQLAAEAQAIAADPERYAEAQTNATNWGVSVGDAIRAMSGDATAIELVAGNLDRLNAEIQAYNSATTAPTEEEIQRWLTQNEQFDAGSTALAQLNANMALGQQIARDTSDALLGIVQNAGDASLEVDELGNKLYTLPDNTQVLVSAETGLATRDLSTFKGDLDGISETVSTATVKVDVDRSAVDALDRDIARGRVFNLEASIRAKGQRIL